MQVDIPGHTSVVMKIMTCVKLLSCFLPRDQSKYPYDPGVNLYGQLHDQYNNLDLRGYLHTFTGKL